MLNKDKKKRGIPTVSKDRMDTSPIDSSVGTNKVERTAHSFIKGKEPIQALSLRLPVSLYKELREVAYKTEDKINQIIVRAVREHLKRQKEQTDADN